MSLNGDESNSGIGAGACAGVGSGASLGSGINFSCIDSLKLSQKEVI